MIQWKQTLLILLLVSHSSHGKGKNAKEENFFVMDTAKCEKANPTVVKVKSSSHVYLAAKEMDCAELLSHGHNASGIYTIWPKSRISKGKALDVFCDMDTDGGGWTVIQRRGDFKKPRDYFWRVWKDYKTGFGNKEEDFWLGNDNIFTLTNQDLYTVRFDLQDGDGERRYAVYDTFWIEDEDRKYTLHIDGYWGNAGDSMIKVHNKQKFTTIDQKNDNSPGDNCAKLDKGAWWYNNCHEANLNGLAYVGDYQSTNWDGIVWHTWKGYKHSMMFAEIKIRPKDYRSPKTRH